MPAPAFPGSIEPSPLRLLRRRTSCRALGSRTHRGPAVRTSIRAGFRPSLMTCCTTISEPLSLPPQLSTTVDVTGLDQSGFLAGGGILPNTSVSLRPRASLRELPHPDLFRTSSGRKPITGISAFSMNLAGSTFSRLAMVEHGVYFCRYQEQLNVQPVVNASKRVTCVLQRSQPSHTKYGCRIPWQGLQSAFDNGGNIVPCVCQRWLYRFDYRFYASRELDLSRMVE